MDIIHAHVWSNKTLFAFILSVIYNKPLFISEHWSGYQNHNGFIQKGLMKLVFKRAKGYCFSFFKNLMQRQGINGSLKSLEILKNKKLSQ